jgi:DUF1680 family protein
MYAQNGNSVFVNLFINSTASMRVNQNEITIRQENNYPWQGDLKFIISTMKPTVNFALKIRIPGWAGEEAIPSNLYTFQSIVKPNKLTILVNGKAVEYQMENGYAVITRDWKKNDQIQLDLPMDVRRVYANENVKSDIGKVALQRGPLMYCAEWVDNEDQVANFILPKNSVFTTQFQPELLNGVMTIQAMASKVEWKNDEVRTVNKKMTAIPYYAWANRGKGDMTVWFNEKIKDIEIVTK